MIILSELAEKLNVHRSTMLKAVSKMDIPVTKHKKKGVASKYSAVEDKYLQQIKENFGFYE